MTAPACRPRSAPGCSSRGCPPRPAGGGSASPSRGGSSSSSTAGGCPTTRGPMGPAACSCWSLPWPLPRPPRAPGPGSRDPGDPMTLALNPQQAAAVRHPGGPLLVLAGAGSGKTRVLTARIAYLIQEQGVAPQRIFAVTFTNKAAGEMRSRVATLLGANPKGLWIGTFHSLSARLLRREAAALGFGPNFTIYDQDDSDSFIKRLLEQRGLSPKANLPRAIHAVISSAKNHPGATLIKLEQNYRSTQVILDAANGVIAENTRRLCKTLFTATPGGEPVTLLAAADERDEAEWLAAELVRRSAEADVPYEGMAILYRTNAQSRPLEEAFRFRGIPYRLVGAVSFYERREVKDVLAYLRLIANPADDEAFVRIVNVPRRGIGDASLSQLLRTATQWGRPLLETARAAERIADLRPNVREAFQALARLIDELRARVADADPATALEQVIAAVGYGPYLADEGPEGIERLENVQELIAGAAAWAETAVDEGDEGGATSAIERYLTQAALVTSAEQGTGDPTGVTLMTVHMAKGLEWPVVTLAGLEDGLFPLARAAAEPGGLEEERRLCYVGLTRAREKLYLSWARTRYRNGRLELSESSRFLEALPPAVVEQRSTTPQWDRARHAGGARRGARAPVEIEWEAEASQDAPRYIAGERVRHRKFGSRVVRAVSGSGRELKVMVEFDDSEIGTKQLLVAYAGLEREWESA